MAHHSTLGTFTLRMLGQGEPQGNVEVLLTDNETNVAGLYTQPSAEGMFTKDAFDRYVARGEREAIHTQGKGTKAAILIKRSIAPGAVSTVYLQLTDAECSSYQVMSEADAERCFTQCRQDADAFYGDCLPAHLTPDEKNIARQAYAGLLWSKQFYHYVSDDWLQGSMTPTRPALRPFARNTAWPHLFCRDVLSVPDKWEYPWLAAWDSALVSRASLKPGTAHRAGRELRSAPSG